MKSLPSWSMFRISSPTCLCCSWAVDAVGTVISICFSHWANTVAAMKCIRSRKTMSIIGAIWKPADFSWMFLLKFICP